MIEKSYSIAYFLLFVLIFIYSTFNPRKRNLILGVCTVIYLCVGAGFRTDGWDLDNWLLGIDFIRGGEDFRFRMAIAKDPVWFFIVSVTNWISEEKWLPILAIVSASAIIKYHSIWCLRGNTALFFSLYGFLLAPELDFSGMRSSLAGAFLLSVCVIEKSLNKSLASVLSILSHQSSAVHLLWYIYKPIKTWHFALLIITIFLIFLFGQNFLIQYIDRLESYEDQQSKLGAVYMPILSCIFWIVFYKYKYRKLDILESNIASMIYIIYGVSVAISPFFVTFSHRILELGHILFLALMVSYVQSTKLSKIQFIAFGLFGSMLIIRHIIGQNYTVVRW